MADRLPLAEASRDEILARVTYQIIMADYRKSPELYDTPSLRLLDLAVEWDDDDYYLIHEQITLAALWVANGGSVATWLAARIFTRTGRATMIAHPGRTRNR